MARQNQLKDVDSICQTQVLQNFVRTFPFLGLLGLILGGVLGFLIGLGVSVIVVFITDSFSSALGGGFAKLIFGIGRQTSNLRDRLAGDLNIARVHKTNHRYDEGLSKLNEILSLDPNFPEALFLKSQVLWEGFKDRDGAKVCLLRGQASRTG
jgi:hypothetical protein